MTDALPSRAPRRPSERSNRTTSTTDAPLHAFASPFVVSVNDRLRIGKLTGDEAVGRYEVRFTDVPGYSETVERIDRSEMVRVHLPIGHTVWVKHATFGYAPGTVAAQMDDGRYIIRAGNPETENLTVDSQSLVVRDGSSFRSPVGALAVGMVDHLEVYRSRIGAIRSFVAQRVACRGYTALLSAAVRPFRHQANVLVQVMNDPIRRYVLADEVGLGKTIEAGLVLRQMLLDDPEARALVAVPSSLIAQWQNELETKLLLGGAFESRWDVVSHDELLSARRVDAKSGDSRLLIIDEAHRIAERALVNDREAQTLERIAQAIRSLLLLTATPIRGHADVFHYLLHLIDPRAHPKDDVEAFRSRVELREDMANSIEVVADPGVPWLLVDETLREFTETFPNDDVLGDLVGNAIEAGDDGRELAMQVAEYLRETYRLSRRVIRNRRSSVPEFPVAGRNFEVVEFDDPSAPVAEEFVEAARIAMQEENDSAGFEALVDAALAGPVALLAHVRTMERAAQSPDLLHAIAVLRARLETTDVTARVETAAAWVATWWSRRSGSVVVITSHRECAVQLVERLRARLGERHIAVLLEEMEVDASSEVLSDFARSEGPSVLVVDRFAEEGLNLQFADAMLHLDTPLSVNRLEQRVGRLDRFSEAIQHGKRNVRLRANSDWEQARDELHEATGVYESSVATLQRPLAALEADLRRRMLNDGQTAFTSLAAGLGQLLADERGEIERLEELEEFSGRIGFNPEDFEDFEDFEEDWGNVQHAVDALTDRTHGLYLVRVRDPSNRALFEYSAPGRNSLPRIPQPDLQRLAPVMKGLRTFNRPLAVRNPGVQVVRVGDPIVDWMADFIQSNERGRTRASLRHCPGIRSPQLWFQLDVTLQTAVPSGEPHAVPEQTFRRVSDTYLRPLTLNVWSDGHGPPTDEFKSSNLTSLPPESLGEQPISSTTWPILLEEFPRFASLVEAAHADVERRVIGDGRTADAIERAVARISDEFERRERTLRRVLAVAAYERQDTETELARDDWLRSALIDGVRHPELKVLAIGAYLLTPSPPS